MGVAADIVLPASATLQPYSDNGLHFYKFNRLKRFAELEHAVFTRLGGVSSVPFSSLNVSYDTGDEAGKVSENLRRIRLTMGSANLIYARQNHGRNIVVIRGQPRIDPTLPYPLKGKDGFITQLPGVITMVKVADCQAIFLYDPQKRVAAVVHSGWRGSVQNIAGYSVQLMTAEFGCKPHKLTAAISPSLGPCCAEFRHWQKELPASFSRFRLSENRFDFWAISKHQLEQAGLAREHIEVAGLCTKCHPKIFYSYRGEGKTGRFAAAIVIKNRD